MTGDPIDRTLVGPAAERARDPRSHRLLYLAGALVVVGVAGLAVWAFLSIGGLRADVVAAQGSADAAGQSARTLADQVRQLGGTPVVQPPLQGATGAQGVAGPMGPRGPKGDKGDPGVPGQSPPCLADLAHCQGAAGAQGLTGTKGDEGPKGDPGEKGDPGQPGADGAQGVSVTDVAPVRQDDGSCVWVVSLHDPKTGQDSTATHPAGDAACPSSPSSPTETPAVLPSGTNSRRRY